MRVPQIFFYFAVGLHIAISCSPPDFQFVPPREGSCEDEAQNDPETDEDCGGGECPQCEIGKRCVTDNDCTNQSCVKRVCQLASCTNDDQDLGETDVDCGGPNCPDCEINQHCEVSFDCASNLCINGKCVTSSCDNKMFDPSLMGETDTDCGGTVCPACKNGKACGSSGDCIEGNCVNKICIPLKCSNLLLDTSIGEEMVDCGGPCTPCSAQNPCLDGAQNLGETGLDCGGETACKRCPNDQGCGTNSDCESAYCDLTALLCADDPCAESVDACDGGAGGAPSVTGGMGGAPPASGGTGDGGSPETGGSGGVAEGGTGALPEGGTSPQGGTGGTTGGGGTGGSTGGAAMGPLTNCPTGCARLRVPLAGSGDLANYVIPLMSVVDFSAAVITARVYVEQGMGGEVKAYVQHSGTPDYLQLFDVSGTPLAEIAGWQDIVFDVGAQMTTFTKNNVGRVGIQVNGANGSSFANPTIVAVDSITITGVPPATIVFQFANSQSIQTASASTGTPNVMFLNSGDGPVANATLAWIPP